MNQLQFEKELRSLKAKKQERINAISEMQSSVKQELADLHKHYKLLHEKSERLNTERRVLGMRKQQIEIECNKIIREFMDANQSCMRTLEDVSEWAIIRELHARGYYGELRHNDKPEDFMLNLNKRLNGFNVEEDEDNGTAFED